MQYYSKEGRKYRGKSKSHMAEFSPNPDERLKSDISYSAHTRRLKEEASDKMQFRVRVNRKRDEKGLKVFLDQDQKKFDDIIECGKLEGEELWSFLTICDLDARPEDIKENTKPNLSSNEISPIIVHGAPMVKSIDLAHLLNIDHNDLIYQCKQLDILNGHIENFEMILLSTSDEYAYMSYQRILALTLFSDFPPETIRSLDDIGQILDKENAGIPRTELIAKVSLEMDKAITLIDISSDARNIGLNFQDITLHFIQDYVVSYIDAWEIKNTLILKELEKLAGNILGLGRRTGHNEAIADTLYGTYSILARYDDINQDELVRYMKKAFYGNRHMLLKNFRELIDSVKKIRNGYVIKDKFSTIAKIECRPRHQTFIAAEWLFFRVSVPLFPLLDINWFL